jgi:hypothetical protein
MQALASSTKPLAYQLEGHRLITSLPYLDANPSDVQLKLINQMVQDELVHHAGKAAFPPHQSGSKAAERPLLASTSFHLGDLENDVETPMLDRLLQARSNKYTNGYSEKEELASPLGKRLATAVSESDEKPLESIKTRDEYDRTVIEVERMKQR